MCHDARRLLAIAAALAGALGGAAAPGLAGAQSPGGADSLRGGVQRNREDVRRRVELAEALVAAGRQREAITEYEDAARRAPGNVDVLRRLAQLYTWNAMPRGAETAYARILHITPGDVETRRLLAQQYFWTERPREGIRQLEIVLEQRPDDLAARRTLAQQYVWQGMADKAVEQFRQVVERDPSDLRAASKLAEQLVWRGRPAEAVPLYERVVAAEPDSVGARLMLARALAAVGRGAEAQRHLVRVVRAEPRNGGALLLLAELERWSGQWDSARARLRRVLALEPSNARAAELLRGIRKQFGPRVESTPTRTTDSNGLTVDEVPLRAEFRPDRRWELGAALTARRLASERTAETLTGYAVGARAQYNVSLGGSAQLAVAVSPYTSGWSPVSGQVQVSQRFADRYHATARLIRAENREGVRALQERITATRFEGELYIQATDRASISGAVYDARYSDDNTRVAGVGFASYRVRLRNPGLTVHVSDAYEDARRNYPAATPYWTPDRLRTRAGRLALEQAVRRNFQVRGSVGVAAQRGIVSSTYGLELDLRHVEFQTLSLGIERLGSEVYRQRTVRALYEYRF